MLNYADANVSLYQSDGDRVLAGRRLAKPSNYVGDGITLKCHFCGRLDVRFWVVPNSAINLEAVYDTLDVVVLKESRDLEWLQVERWGHSVCVHTCDTCSAWHCYQFMPWEQCEFVAQVVGKLETFPDTDDVPMDRLLQYLSGKCLDLKTIGPNRFEHVCAEFLRHEWTPCEVRVVGAKGGSGDGGIDLILVHAEEDYLVQVKHHPQSENNEGVKFIRELNGVLFREGKPRGVFVTSAPAYTRHARSEIEIARQNNDQYEMILYDHVDLKRWLASTQSQPWDDFLYTWEKGHVVRFYRD